MCLVPTMANALLNVPGADQFQLSSMRQIVLGGAASSPPFSSGSNCSAAMSSGVMVSLNPVR